MSLTRPQPARTFDAAKTYASQLWGRREFAWYLAMGNLKARNASTVLGLFWWVLNPLLLGLVYVLVFGVILKRDTSSAPDAIPFVAWLLSGIFPFYFIQTAFTGGFTSFLANSNFVSNDNVPRLVLSIFALI